MRSFASGELRAKISSRCPASSASSSRLGHRVQLGAGDHARVVRVADADLRARSARAVSPWSPVTTMIRMPAVWQRATASGDLRPRRVDHRDEPEQGQLALGVVPAVSDGVRRGQRPLGHGEHPQPLARPTRRSGGRHGAAVVLGQRPVAGRRGQPRCSGAAPPPARPCVASRRPAVRARRRSTSVAGPGRSGTGAGAAGARRRPAAPAAAAKYSRATSVGSPCALAGSAGSSGRCCRSPRPGEPATRGVGRRGPVAAGGATSRRRSTPGRPHPVQGQGAGLVGADHGGRAERLHRGEALDQRALAGEHPHADGQGQGDRRQQALGHVGDQQADREVQRVAEAAGRPAASRSG